jgi:hypothetical protein
MIRFAPEPFVALFFRPSLISRSFQQLSRMKGEIVFKGKQIKRAECSDWRGLKKRIVKPEVSDIRHHQVSNTRHLRVSGIGR